MTGASPPGFLEFFILEASDYVEQLDALLLGGNGVSGMNAADAATMQRVARALRGTATMAKLSSYAELAAAVERVGRSLQDGAVRWDPALNGALVAAIDDLKGLLHHARTWSPGDDQRAAARAAELARHAPAMARGTAGSEASSSAAEPATAFFGTEAANIAAGLELLTTRAGDAATAANVLRRVRALRGVAGVKEIASLAEVLEATEEAARGLEDPQAHASLTSQARQVLEAAAGFLRAQSAALRTGGQAGVPSAEREAFEAAHEAWSTTMAGGAADRERVVPISELFYGGEGSGVVEASANPPTSSEERFRLELVSLGEHLRQVVAAARQSSSAGSPGAVARASRDVHRVLDALEAAARSFGEKRVAEFVAGHGQAADRLDYLSLSALEDLASVVAQPGDAGERLRARISDVARGRDFSAAIGAGFGEGEMIDSAPSLMSEVKRVSSQRPAPAPLFTPAAAAGPASPPAPPQPAAAPTPLVPTPVASRPALPTPAAPRPAVPAPAPAAALLDSTIAALESMPDHAFAHPTPIPEDVLVPIESLLYQGRSALDRAVEIRDDLRRRGGAASPDPAALEELFDLLELARAE